MLRHRTFGKGPRIWAGGKSHAPPAPRERRRTLRTRPTASIWSSSVFCLYLCDPADYFNIAQQADRVLKDKGYLVILDFLSTVPYRAPYSHHDGIFSHKMNWAQMFTWHPVYRLISRGYSEHAEPHTFHPHERIATDAFCRRDVEFGLYLQPVWGRSRNRDLLFIVRSAARTQDRSLFDHAASLTMKLLAFATVFRAVHLFRGRRVPAVGQILPCLAYSRTTTQ